MPHEQAERAGEVIRWCREIAALTEEPGWTTRTFLSPPMREVHARLRTWMERLGIAVTVDAVGNLRGFYAGREGDAPRLLIGSHLDTVPHAGAFDGVLGVVLAIALIEALCGRRLGFGIEVIGFSEEEGVRFGVPFIGSRALVGTMDSLMLDGRIAAAIREFGLDPARICDAVVSAPALGYIEFHIEQGPVLESLGLPLGVVDAIAGQSRFEVRFEGSANHAGTTPMNLRRDALAAAAEWIGRVEREACTTPRLVATVGQVEVDPGAVNVIAGAVRASLDVRHPHDEARSRAVECILTAAREIAVRRGVRVDWQQRSEQAAATMDTTLTDKLDRAVEAAGCAVHRMVSGAGHDAMILARRVPAAMLSLRSPGGISHHPDESVLLPDVAAALDAGLRFLDQLEA